MFSHFEFRISSVCTETWNLNAAESASSIMTEYFSAEAEFCIRDVVVFSLYPFSSNIAFHFFFPPPIITRRNLPPKTFSFRDTPLLATMFQVPRLATESNFDLFGFSNNVSVGSHLALTVTLLQYSLFISFSP